MELEWWNSYRHGALTVTHVPSRHWGARVLKDSHRGYGGYVLRAGKHSMYHAGDTAYFSGFREIGQRLSPELALLPIGAYHPENFRNVHTSPADATRAFLDLKSRWMVPMHYGTFRLSHEPMVQELIPGTAEEMYTLGSYLDREGEALGKKKGLGVDWAKFADAWRAVSRDVLAPAHPHAVHRLCWDDIFAAWDEAAGPRPAWIPTASEAADTHIAKACARVYQPSYAHFFRWSVDNREDFWRDTVETLGIRFRANPERILDAHGGPEHARWFPGASLNIAESCFQASGDATAIVWQREGGKLESVSYAELDALSTRDARGVPVAHDYIVPNARRGSLAPRTIPPSQNHVCTRVFPCPSSTTFSPTIAG